MDGYWVLCIVGCIVQAIFIIVDRKGHNLAACILKGTASVIFTIYGFLGLRGSVDHVYALLVCLGLLMGAIGDVGMHLRLLFPKKRMETMAVGTACFLIGHLLYLNALVPQDPKCLIPALLPALLVWGLVYFLLIRKIEVKLPYKILGTVYMLIICLMMSVTFSLMIAHPEVLAYKIYAVGAVLFIASDYILSLNLFLPEPKKWYRPVNLAIYYLAQLLIATTVYYIV